MKTIKKNLLERLVAQADEAEFLGLTSVSQNLTKQIVKNAACVRDDESFYSYSSEELQSDVEDAVWDAVIRIADFYNTTVDANYINNYIKSCAYSIIDEIRVTSGISTDVGPYEMNVPGEIKEHVVVEVTEKE